TRRETKRAVVLAMNSAIDAETQIAEARRVSRLAVRDAVERAIRSVFEERDGNAQTESRALPQDHRGSRMNRDDVAHDLRVDAAVGVVDRERPILAFEHDARGGTEFFLRTK